MFDKFFTMRPEEKREVLSVTDGQVMQITVTGTIEDKIVDEAIGLFTIADKQNADPNAKVRLIKIRKNEVYELELKDREVLTIESACHEIDFHINGHIYQVN